jgi:hypothetical protein
MRRAVLADILNGSFFVLGIGNWFPRFCGRKIIELEFIIPNCLILYS